MAKVKTDLILPVPLTDEEFATRASDMAHKTREANSLELARQREESDWKAKNKTLKEEVAGLLAVAADLAEDVETRTKKAPVECDIIYDFERFKLAWKRCDTGEIVAVREMEESEKSMQLEIEQQEVDDDIRAAMDDFEKQMSEDTPITFAEEEDEAEEDDESE